MEKVGTVKVSNGEDEHSENSTCRSLACLNNQIVALLNDGSIKILTSCGLKYVSFGETDVLVNSKFKQPNSTVSTESIHGTDKELLFLEVGGKLSCCTLTNIDTDTCTWVMSPLTSVLCAEPIVTVSCGKEHVLLLGQNRQIYSYGGGSRGQLGHGDVVCQKEPQLVEALAGVGFSSVAAGGWHSVALSDIGDVWVWGWNESGQLGLPCNGNDIDRKILLSKSTNPSEACLEKCEKQIDSEIGTNKLLGESSSALFDSLSSSNLSRSDENQLNARMLKDCMPQLSSNTTTDSIGSLSSNPKPPDSMESHVYVQNCVVSFVHVQSEPCGLDLLDTRVKQISCGSRHTALLTDAGVVLTCGWNKYGQLCHGDTLNRDFFRSVDLFVKQTLEVTDIHCGQWNTIVITENKIHNAVPTGDLSSHRSLS
ncbi:ultraviolet-B receptor UVR8-like isoform X2 [Pecten maximus]|uniref:ultraviolet-B receptor UVR8-like isoform X2 n=2 Tax=Pecten maximus TaxID=6579 RepID=UPI0014584859|nr:ultraviolet-B receptor UVR8-like isoform X2 [Pecten maximus]